MDEAVLKKLQRKGFEPTPTNLHLTLQSGMADTLDALELCLHSGVSPETRDPKPPHVTPLMVAVSRRRQPKVIARLLAAGANPALTDEQGGSAVAHLVAHFDAEVSKKQDTFAEVFAMLTAHPEVSAFTVSL
jgi:ankyrin repeat protein